MNVDILSEEAAILQLRCSASMSVSTRDCDQIRLLPAHHDTNHSSVSLTYTSPRLLTTEIISRRTTAGWQCVQYT